MSSFASSRQLNLESSFDRHGSLGIEFLLEQLAKTSDQNLKISTIYLRRKSFLSASIGIFMSLFATALSHISSFLCRQNTLRQKLIIALGWVGRSKEIYILTREMLESRDSLCRAWSSASLMQMSFHRVKQEVLCEKTKALFIKAFAPKKSFCMRRYDRDSSNFIW